MIRIVQDHLGCQPGKGPLESVLHHGGSVDGRHASQAHIGKLGIGLVPTGQQDVGGLHL